MVEHEIFMQRCLELATLGNSKVQPNPMVGAVLVHQGKVVAEGWHQEYGSAHAEINALNALKDPALAKASTLYVTLEPCSHFGKTPPCVNTIISKGIPKIVLGTIDSNPITSGKGIEKLINAGIEVVQGVCQKECLSLNKRFFTYHSKKRPYIILKWAQTLDGFVAKEDYTSKWISSEEARNEVHKWRATEAAILVGTKTALFDNPMLTARLPNSRQPVRVVIDRKLQIPKDFHIYDKSAETLILNEIKNDSLGNCSQILCDLSNQSCQPILDLLFQKQIVSLLVEGGSFTLNRFISENVWDEAQVFISAKNFKSGIKAPTLSGTPNNLKVFGDTKLFSFYNQDNAFAC